MISIPDGSRPSLTRSWDSNASDSRHASGSETESPDAVAASSRPQISVDMRVSSVTPTRPEFQVAISSS